jgi:hypothetical protein
LRKILFSKDKILLLESWNMLFALFYANSKAENVIEDFKEPLTHIKMSHSK